jgi:two-component system, OmpR family, sensor histidine kinase BaeS
MFRSLRARLILSHTLPLLVIIPLIYIALAYLLETQFLLPKLTEELLDNARLVTGVVRTSDMTSGEPTDIQFTLLRLDINPRIRLLYLQPDGTLMYSNDPDAQNIVGQRIQVPEMNRLNSGKDVILTSYSFLVSQNDSINVLRPIINNNRQLVGILWMTYYEASLNQLFQQFRLLAVVAIVGSGLAAALLGSLLAFSLSTPIRQATQAINGLTRGERSGPLQEQGPDEVRDLARAVNVLVTRLHSLEQARRQLLANLVHELGRPLGALRSAIQALAHGASSDPQLLSDLTAGMDEETARLQYLLTELSHLHDLVLGALELDREPTAMSEWLPRVLPSWQEYATQKRLQWLSEIPADLPVILADQTRLAQVVGNLASNAIKYTPSGGSITVSAGQADSQVWFRIKDSGPGIAPDEQEKIFEPFYRGDTGRRIKQGMGLGLSIARDLVAAHRGRIELESQPGAGSQFTVWLPIE